MSLPCVRQYSGRWGNSPFALVRAVTIAGLWCCLFAPPTSADEGLPTHENWGFATAALELRRLPPSNAGHDSIAPESSESAVVWTAQAVSFSELDGSDQPDPWDDDETRLYLGYDRGFVIAADQAVGSGASSADFLMRVNSWMQLRHTLFESHGPNADQNTFSFERLRLSFGGHVLSPELKYFFQLDGNSDRSTDAIFLDYFVSYDLGRDRFGLDEDKLGIKLGKWKVPFSRSRQESARLLQFSDRATANIFFDLNRSLGVGLYGRLDHLAKPIQFETAVFNGFGTGNLSTNRSDTTDGLDRNFGWSLRGQTDLLGEFGNDGEPDLSWHVAPSLRLGGGLAFTRVDSEGPSEFRRERVVDSGAALSSILPATVTAYDVWLSTVDAHWKYHGLSFIADYYWRYISQFSGDAVPSLFDHGFLLQAGYFVIPQKLEMISRWSRISGDSGTLGVGDASSDEVAGGFVWYIKGHNAKLTFDASRYNGAPVSSSRLDLRPGDAGWLFRTQCQIAF